MGTYAVANTIDSACDWLDQPSKVPKFLGTTATNMLLVIQKDVVFTKMFSNHAPTPMPKASLALFAIRDSHTIATAFLLPPVLGHWFANKGYVKDAVTGEFVVQLAAPCVIQLFSTPYHLLALDLYNRPHASRHERWNLVRKNYAMSAVARVGRILPAFGIGGVTNRSLRQSITNLLAN